MIERSASSQRSLICWVKRHEMRVSLKKKHLNWLSFHQSYEATSINTLKKVLSSLNQWSVKPHCANFLTWCMHSKMLSDSGLLKLRKNGRSSLRRKSSVSSKRKLRLHATKKVGRTLITRLGNLIKSWLRGRRAVILMMKWKRIRLPWPKSRSRWDKLPKNLS